MKLSVIICSHNPRAVYLTRVLGALKDQTLPKNQWELLLIDNASEMFLASEWDLGWHPFGRHIRENELGLIAARLRGIKEAKGELLVFVDDDNVLADDYLQECVRIGAEMQFLGAWGGQQFGEFEIPPPTWALPYMGMLALREITHDMWSNLTHSWDTIPYGAGLCVRLEIAQAWLNKVVSSSERRMLGRSGAALSSAEDTDLALTACDIGLGAAVLKCLRLTHLIPKERFDLSYFERLLEGMGRSHVVLKSFRGAVIPSPHLSVIRKLMRSYRMCKMDATVRRLELARQKGYDEGIKIIGVR